MFKSLLTQYRACQFPWHIFTALRILNGLFTFFSLALLSAGGTIAAFALSWMYPTPSSPSPTGAVVSFISLVLIHLDITVALIIGVILIATVFFSIPAMISRGTTGLNILNLVLTLDMLGVIGASSMIWWRGLRTRNMFWEVWQASTPAVRGAIQDQWGCCGYWSSSDLSQVAEAGVCGSPALAAARPACVDPFTAYAGNVLNNTSTFMYVVAGLIGAWFMITACLIAERKLQKRFRLIERKQDNMAFV